jgi:hypothetical protein
MKSLGKKRKQHHHKKNHHHNKHSHNNNNNNTLHSSLTTTTTTTVNVDPMEYPLQKNLQNLLKSKDKLTKIQSLILPNTSYSKLKYKSDYFSIGDKLIIFSSNENLIGELTRILPSNGNKRYPIWPTIEVKWYYKKTDINRKKNNLLDELNYNSISDYELFPTEHKDIVFIETIIGKCQIYTYNEYESLDDHNEYTFFTRARYDPKNQLLIPRFDEWIKGCVCKRPLNPEQLYIKCEKCNGWFHPECCGLTQEDADELKHFYCPNCKS